MWNSRLFWKLFVSYAALILAATAVFSGVVSAHQRSVVHAYLEERLRDDAALMRSRVQDWLNSESTPELQEFVEQLARETHIRMTVVAPDGRVLADSDQDPDHMENHRSRPEIENAARDGVVVGTHVSRTLGIPMMYLAMRVDRGERAVGFVRVALPMEQVEKRVAAMQRLVWGMGLAVGMATLVITLFVVAGLT